MDVIPVPVLADNYSYLVIDPRTNEAGVVDCADADPVLAEVERRGVRLTCILATHHHWDHVGGNETLLARHRLRVYGNRDDAARIPGLTDGLGEGDEARVGTLSARILFIPAHTSGHLAYYFSDAATVFTGDTLFAGGCGRLFEGDAAQMMASLKKLAGLPPPTRVYCGHEYTEKNLTFAATLEPGNSRLAEKRELVRRLRAAGKPTVPTTIDDELATNPFLRVTSAEIGATLRARYPDLGTDPVAIFAKMRALKDAF
jgi:hydroxyacylglutathione hydrolase